MEYRYIVNFFFFFFFLCVTGSLYVPLFSGEVIVIRYQHIAGCQSLYSYILSCYSFCLSCKLQVHG